MAQKNNFVRIVYFDLQTVSVYLSKLKADKKTLMLRY